MTYDEPIPLESPADQDLLLIREALRGVRFGTVKVIIQDGVIVQIDRTEKRRLSGSERKSDVLGN